MALGRKPIEIINDGKHQLLVKSGSWDRILLNEIATIQNGYAFSSEKFSKTEGVPLIRIRDIDNEVTEDLYNGNFDDTYIVKKGDILIGMDGDFKVSRWKGKDGLLNQRVCRIKLKSPTYDERFLFVCLQPYLDAIHAETSAVTVKHLSSKTIGEIPLPYPPLPEQQAIVAKIEQLFSELDKGKEQLLTAQQQLKIYRQSLLKWAFEGKLTNKNVKEGELPEGWKWVRIVDVAEKITDGEHFKPQTEARGIPFLSAKDVREEGVCFDNILYISEKVAEKTLQRCNPQKGDILIVSRGASVGRTCIVKTKIRFCLLGSVILIKTNKSIISEYLKYLLKSPLINQKIIGVSGATAQQAIYLRDIKKVGIPLPQLKEQQQVVSELESRLTVCDKIEETINQSLQQAEMLRQSILKQAFEGKLVSFKPKVVYKPKSDYFYQSQLLGLIVTGSKKKDIQHGEMTIAKYAYLLEKIYDIPTYFNYQRWHLGPYPPEMKKVVLNKNFFTKTKEGIELTNEKELLKYNNPLRDQTENAVAELANIFLSYNEKDRAHKTELLATVCKVIEDIQTLDINAVRASMTEWNIDLKNSASKNKAEKFFESETKKCLQFIKEKGWDKKLIK